MPGFPVIGGDPLSGSSIIYTVYTTILFLNLDKRLFTPGPLGVNYETKAAMLRDLGSRDIEFMAAVKEIRTRLLEFANISNEEFTMIPLQGSGTFAIEGTIMTMVPKTGGKLLLAITGSYGKRMIEIAKYSNIDLVKIVSLYF